MFTATEAGVVACICAFVVSFFVYRSITLRDMGSILIESAITTALVSGIIAVAGALAGVWRRRSRQNMSGSPAGRPNAAVRKSKSHPWSACVTWRANNQP